jgi:DNA-binding transcriptional MocR family regulator
MLIQRVQSLIRYCWRKVTKFLEEIPTMRSRIVIYQATRLPCRTNVATRPSMALSSLWSRLYHTSEHVREPSRLSAPRAAKAVALLPSYLVDARAVTKYSPQTPDGALQLSVAENQMLEDLLVPGLTELCSTQVFPADAIYYQPTHGRPQTREAMARYLEDLLRLSRPMDANGIVVGAGCNAVLENLCICLAEPGEGVMIPTPYYAAFEFDLVARAGTLLLTTVFQ